MDLNLGLTIYRNCVWSASNTVCMVHGSRNTCLVEGGLTTALSQNNSAQKADRGCCGLPGDRHAVAPDSELQVAEGP